MMAATTSATSIETAIAKAQAEGIEPNVARWLRFVGHEDGEAIELQAIKVVHENRWEANYAAHARTLPALVRLLTDAERRFRCPGLYLIANRLHDAVATRAEPDKWNRMQKGDGTSDAEITSRRVLFVDVDAKRPKGTSATDAQVERTAEAADRIVERLSRVVGPEAIGLGHSGNGRGVFVALDFLDEGAAPLILGVVHAVSRLFGGDGIEIDKSVTDAKRLVPAWGTLKRKGAAGVAERPHRRTAFVCSERVRRVSLDELAALLHDLRSDLDDEGSAVVDKAMGAKATPRTTSAAPSKSSASDSPFTRAKAVPIADVLAWLGLFDGDRPVCPGCRLSDQGVVIFKNGLKCSHARCASKGHSGGFRTVVDVVTEARSCTPVDAVKALAERFGFRGFERTDRASSSDAEAPRPTIVTVGAAEIFAPLPPFPFLVRGLHIGPGRPTMLAGYADVGKTIIAQSIAISLAAGEDVFGVFRPARRGRVLHLDGEMGAHRARERYQRLARAMAVDVADLAERNALRLATYPPVRLDDPNAEGVLVEACEGFDLVVLDSLTAFSGGLDENSKDVGVALYMLARVSEATGAVILVIHHTKKPTKEHVGGAKTLIRGSSSIVGGCDSIFVASTGAKGEPSKVEHERSPIGVTLDDFGIRIEDVEIDGDARAGLIVRHLEGEQLPDAESRQAEAEDAAVAKAVGRVRAFFGKHAGRFTGSEAELRRAIGGRTATVATALARMKASGEVIRSGEHHAPVYELRRSEGAGS